MSDAELQALGAKAANLPEGRNELSPKPLCAVTAQAVVDPQGRLRIYNVETGEIVTIRQADGAPITAAADVAALKAALQTVLSEAGIAVFG